MHVHLENKVVLVTGGAKGVGAAIVRAIAEEGGLPIFIDSDVASARELQTALSDDGLPSHFVECDLCSAGNCATAVGRACQLEKRLDALINNAGGNDSLSLEKGTPEQFVSSLERNLHHYYNVAHYAVPALKSARGSIINIVSEAALSDLDSASGYAAITGAILALTREWAAELVAFGMRVNAIVPAEGMTPPYQRWPATFENPRQKLSTMVSKAPPGKRMRNAQGIAAMALFLLSPHAAHITGQHIFVDGGSMPLDRALT